MITNPTELEVACRHLKGMEVAYEGVRAELTEINPGLLSLVSSGYIRRIKDLQCDISSYVATHPEAVSLLLHPDFAMRLAATKEMEEEYLARLHEGQKNTE